MAANPSGLEPVLIDPRSEPLVCIPVNRAWIAILIGAINPLRYPEYWGGTLAENRQMRAYSRDLIESIMNFGECDVSNDCCVNITLILHRVDPITLQLQISIDNGATWMPDPNSIASQITEQVPPVTSGMSGTKCDAATNGKQHMEDWIAGVSTAFDTYGTFFEWGVQVLLIMAGIILWFLTAGALTVQEIAVIEAIAGALHAVFDAGKTIWDNYWISDNTDIILCAFYCNIGDEGSFDEGGYTGVISYLNRNLPANPAKILFLAFLGQIGRVGLNNACSYGNASEADCSSCTCDTCDLSTWTIYDDGDVHGVIQEQTAESITVTASLLSNGSYYAIIVSPDNNTCCEMTGEAGQWVSGVFVPGGAGTIDRFYNNCGEDINTESPHPVIGENFCGRMVEWASSAAFSVRWTSTDTSC